MKHESEDVKEISLAKVWQWILEAFYNTAATRFHWSEFARKVFKDNGEELKRRMIIYSIKNMNPTLESELYEITTVHGKVVKENFGSQYPVLNDLLVVL